MPKMKIVQIFKTYNFYVVQIFTRSKDFEIFLKISKELYLLKEKLFDSRITTILDLTAIKLPK